MGAKELVTGKKFGEFSIAKNLEIALMKSLEETAQAQIIGNGTYKSSGIKILEALGVMWLDKKVGNRWVSGRMNTLATGLAIDSGEDFINAIFNS